MPEPDHRSQRAIDLEQVAWRVWLVLTTVRAHTLLFSVPYLVVWTRGLDPLGRAGLVLAHACVVLVFNTSTDAVDAGRGMAPRLGLTRDPRWTAAPLSRAAAPALSVVAVLGGLTAARLHILAPLAVVALVAAAWAGARAPSAWKYLAGPELALPALLLVGPAAALDWLTDASVPWLSVLSGASCLAALILAAHLRDRERDLADDIPTLATRRPRTARGWLWAAGLAGGLIALGTLVHPLNAAERLALLGGLGILAALPADRYRVPVLTVAHGLLAVTWMLR